MTGKEALEELLKLVPLDKCLDSKHNNLVNELKEIILKDLNTLYRIQDNLTEEKLDIYKNFTLPNLRELIKTLYLNKELTRDDIQIILDIFACDELQNDKTK